jgi:hypothetical protein
MKEPLRTEDLDYAGRIIGYKIEERKFTTPLVNFYIEDDGYWLESFKLDITWETDLLDMAKSLTEHFEKANGYTK